MSGTQSIHGGIVQFFGFSVGVAILLSSPPLEAGNFNFEPRSIVSWGHKPLPTARLIPETDRPARLPFGSVATGVHVKTPLGENTTLYLSVTGASDRQLNALDQFKTIETTVQIAHSAGTKLTFGLTSQNGNDHARHALNFEWRPQAQHHATAVLYATEKFTGGFATYRFLPTTTLEMYGQIDYRSNAPTIWRSGIRFRDKADLESISVDLSTPVSGPAMRKDAALTLSFTKRF